MNSHLRERSQEGDDTNTEEQQAVQLGVRQRFVRVVHGQILKFDHKKLFKKHYEQFCNIYLWQAHFSAVSKLLPIAIAFTD